jgi:hypothetical protein
VVETSGDEETGSGSEEAAGVAEVDGTEPDITDTRLIGLRILPEVSRSEYGWLGFGGESEGGAGAPWEWGRARREEGGEAARVWGAVESPGSLREARNN